jgi:hypothetical protein
MVPGIMCRWYQMKISAMLEGSSNKTPASPARVVQYEGIHVLWVAEFGFESPASKSCIFNILADDVNV